MRARARGGRGGPRRPPARPTARPAARAPPRSGLPTLVFISPDKEKPALRTEGMLPAEQIKEIIKNELQ